MTLKLTNHKTILIITIALFYCLPTYSQTTLIGRWRDTEHTEKQVEIYTEKDNKLYGKNEKAVIVLKGFEYNIKTNTYTGTLVNPDDHEAFEITIKQPSVDKFNFTVRKFIFSKKFIFERVVGK